MVASTTREGGLFAWRTTAKACDPASWPEWGHDGWNTSDVTVDAVRPGPVLRLASSRSGDAVTLGFRAPGDDGRCGQAAAYDVRVSSSPITDANFGSATRVKVGAPAVPGSAESRTVTVPRGARYVAVRALDATSGTAAHPVNLGPAAFARIGAKAGGSGSPSGGPSRTGGGAPSLAATGLPYGPGAVAVLLLPLIVLARRRRA